MKETSNETGDSFVFNNPMFDKEDKVFSFDDYPDSDEDDDIALFDMDKDMVLKKVRNEATRPSRIIIKKILTPICCACCSFRSPNTTTDFIGSSRFFSIF